MIRSVVASSNLRSVGFEGGTLEIEFHSGSVYQYFNVPESVYLGLLRASSKGRYHHTCIKGVYRYKRI
ncbi:KTSC domain-containing protein [Vitreoscilla massiliensis]|uniref:KTSC domain-containing protein n=1 Tax=Vitreoscilla massiliensis TaxID=1689272 RepID=A0ABY4E033_9NEIS|nr:KTSC domain-containing protein [Vitreoscilla massiliensis]UOO89101.1 KTSC domain-containing protein [Vitreoscilla massiliensis]